MKKVLSMMMAFLLVFSMIGCTPKTDTSGDKPEDKPGTETPSKEKPEAKGSIILSTTTSTEDSGLLTFLLPKFTEDTGIEVKTVAVGTGQALQMGKDGEADVLLVHAKESELEFVEEGSGTEREDVMYNDFILVGPKDDPLKLKENSPSDIKSGLKKISDEKAKFVSRGDDSGTHKKELKIWEATNIKPSGDWYIEAGAGMGDVLKMANEKQAYTITDRATYLSMKDDLDLEIVIEKDEDLLNQYGVIPVNPEVLGENSDKINNEGAKEFMNWIISEKGQNLIKEYGVEEYGEPLFIPNAK
ncbi:substrate-binding domain-containing protein [Tissierella creatinophila]|uniref:PBP superfamily domain protein n=1 Tax=Tissierella creatinophila DSM 6911 TaxID=1123403 RepID=A0A1U7M8S6_TISCR|nr:substrate-binding domain-containing protein [Tissierella creatinophila]OLS03733.1 PBP superfamily domain protein [Tissierella creatinophila DSM 6911]